MTGMSGSLGSTQPVRVILGSKVRMVVYLGQKGITAMWGEEWGRGVGEGSGGGEWGKSSSGVNYRQIY